MQNRCNKINLLSQDLARSSDSLREEVLQLAQSSESLREDVLQIARSSTRPARRNKIHAAIRAGHREMSRKDSEASREDSEASRETEQSRAKF